MRNFYLFLFLVVNLSVLNSQTFSKYTGGAAIQSSPCINEGFESTAPGTYTGAGNSLAVSGWTITSATVVNCSVVPTWTAGSPEFSVLATPIFGMPQIGILGNSPFGGNHIVRLNNSTSNYCATKMTQTFPVTTSNNYLNYSYALSLQQAPHSCCDNPFASLIVKDQFGVMIPCLSYTFKPNCPTAGTSYTTNGSFFWSNWQIKSLNLNPYIGQNLTIELMVQDCAYGEHQGFLLFDSECSTSPLSCNCNNAANNLLHVNWCAGQTQAIIQAPPGSQYFWQGATAISPSQATLSAITISNPISGNAYTVTLLDTLGCLVAQAYTLAYTQVGSGTNSTQVNCLPGSTGAATVFPTGSGAGYNYVWINSSSNVVATSSAVSNMAGGIYQVQISASAGCGSTTVFVPITNYSTGIGALSVSNMTVCSGTNNSVAVNFNGASSAYTFSWMPSQFLSSGTGTFVTVTPTAVAGTSNSITYSVICTPTDVNCPITKTLQVVSGASITPLIANVLPVCNNIGTVQIQGTPSGGQYSGSGISSITGVLTASLAAIGSNTMAYLYSIVGCTSEAIGVFSVVASPTVVINGNSQVCSGETATLLALGAQQYSWSTGAQTNPLLINAPFLNSYSVTGMDTVSNCKSNSNFSFAVIQSPSLSVTGQTLMCEGASVQLQVSGANTYSWSNGSNSQTLILSPANSTSITVIGSINQFCFDTSVVAIEVDACLSISENKKHAQFKFFPNPFSEKLELVGEVNDLVNVINGSGDVIFTAVMEREVPFLIDTRNWPPGVYLIQTIAHNRQIKVLKVQD